MGAMGWGSLLSCDRMLRTPIGKGWFRQQTPATSDSTMARSLEKMQRAQLRAILLDSYRLGVAQGSSKCQLRSGKLRIGIIDGSGFGRLLASCFEIVGPISLMVDLEPYEKRGKELPASYALLRRLKTKLGTGFVDLILGDGLYLAAPFFNLCLDELKSDVLVKTDDMTLRIIQDAEGLFTLSDDPAFDIVTVSGVDAMRQRSYQITQADGFFHQGILSPLTVAKVEEVVIGTGQVLTFWVVTSATSLTPEELRELAHLRWDVENNGFKSANQTVVTKRIYSHNPQAQAAVVLILFTVCNLLFLFHSQVAQRLTDYLGVSPTRQLGIELLRTFLTVYAYCEYG